MTLVPVDSVVRCRSWGARASCALVFVLFAAGSVACSGDSSSPLGAPGGIRETSPITPKDSEVGGAIPSEPVVGKIGGHPFKYASARAERVDGILRVSLYSDVGGVSACDAKSLPAQTPVKFYVADMKGPFVPTATGQMTTFDGGKSTGDSEVVVDNFVDGWVHGRVRASFDADNSVSGSFRAPICGEAKVVDLPEPNPPPIKPQPQKPVELTVDDYAGDYEATSGVVKNNSSNTFNAFKVRANITHLHDDIYTVYADFEFPDPFSQGSSVKISFETDYVIVEKSAIRVNCYYLAAREVLAGSVTSGSFLIDNLVNANCGEVGGTFRLKPAADGTFELVITEVVEGSSSFVGTATVKKVG